MINHIKSFGQIKENTKHKFLVIHSSDCIFSEFSDCINSWIVSNKLITFTSRMNGQTDSSEIKEKINASVTSQLWAGEIGRDLDISRLWQSQQVCVLSFRSHRSCSWYFWEGCIFCHRITCYCCTVASNPDTIIWGCHMINWDCCTKWLATLVLLSVTVVSLLHQYSFCDASATVVSHFKQ